MCRFVEFLTVPTAQLLAENKTMKLHSTFIHGTGNKSGFEICKFTSEFGSTKLGKHKISKQI